MKNLHRSPIVDPRETETALRSEHSEAILHGLLTGDWSLVDAIPEPKDDDRVAA